MHQLAITLDTDKPNHCIVTLAINGKPQPDMQGSTPADCFEQLEQHLSTLMGDAWGESGDEPQPGDQGDESSQSDGDQPAADGDQQSASGGGLRDEPSTGGIKTQDEMLQDWNNEAANRMQKRTTIMDVS